MDSIKTATTAPNIGIDRLKVPSERIEKPASGSNSAGAVPFSDLLGSRIDKTPARPPEAKASPAIPPELKFSAHAKARMSSRNIDLSPQDMLRMQEAVQRASDKGSKESLILTDKAAFVVSVKNNTVITAVDKESMRDNIFTNIDSTVMI